MFRIFWYKGDRNEDKYLNRFEKFLPECRKDTKYSAIEATNILSNDSYEDLY